MDDNRYYLSGAAALSLSADHAERLLALRDGDCALLYLHLLRSGGALDVERAAAQLGRSADDVRAAAAKLDRAGLLSRRETPLPPPDVLPEYSAQEIARRSREDLSFRALVAEARRVLGHDLSGADLKTLFGIYDRLGMPGDVIMLLINHCAATLKRRYGEGRLPSMHMVEKEAYRWANREILTAEQAESFIAESDRLELESERVRRALQITGHAPTPSERKYIEGWLAMGYSSEALALAYDRTVINTGKLTWAYMDTIVRSWYEKGLFTPEAIEKGDVRPARRTKPVREQDRPAASTRGDDAERLAELLHVNEVK